MLLTILPYSVSSENSIMINISENPCNNNTILKFRNYLSSNDLLEISYQNDIVTMLQQLDLLMVYNYIENLTSFGLRETGSSACNDVANYIYYSLKNMGLDVDYQNWSDNDLHGSNIEATLPGLDTSNDEIYIFCAHYNTYPSSPGADDNAAGVAAVLSAAKIMSQYNFLQTVLFVLFSGEEQGWIGSSYYSEECASNNDNIIAVFDPDATGYAVIEDGKNKVTVFDYEESEWITDFTVNVAEQLYEYIDLEIVRGGHQWHSAHTSFYQMGYDSIAYFEYEVNPYLHSSRDTFENMNPEYATKVSKLCLATLVELSELYVNGSLEKPSTPNGPTSGKIGEKYSYSSSTTDTDGYDLFYMFDWGDGSKSPWIGPIESGKEVVAEHIWNDKDSYDIRVKAKNKLGTLSDWSDPLIITMPKNKSINEYNVWIFRLIQRFPILEFLI